MRNFGQRLRPLFPPDRMSLRVEPSGLLSPGGILKLEQCILDLMYTGVESNTQVASLRILNGW